MFAVDSDTQVTATVPVGATTGPIRVVTVEGTAASATAYSVSSGLTVEEVATGGSGGVTTVTTAANLTAVVDHLYLASISFKPNTSVVSVTGLGLLWTEVKAQCGGRSQTGISVWKAQGTPTGDEVVTATLSSAPSNAAIGVTRYSGATGIGTVESTNTNGMGGSCSGGTDTSSYSLQLATLSDGAVVYAGVAMRHRSHTPGVGYAEQMEFAQGSGGRTASIAVEDQEFDVMSTVTVNGSFTATVDWAVVAAEIQAGAPAPTPDVTVTPLSRDYGNVVVGQSPTQTIMVSNGN